MELTTERPAIHTNQFAPDFTTCSARTRRNIRLLAGLAVSVVSPTPPVAILISPKCARESRGFDLRAKVITNKSDGKAKFCNTCTEVTSVLSLWRECGRGY